MKNFPVLEGALCCQKKSIYGESPALAVFENVFGFIIRARRRPQITPNDRKLTKNTTSKNSKRRGYTVAQTTSVNQQIGMKCMSTKKRGEIKIMPSTCHTSDILAIHFLQTTVCETCNTSIYSMIKKDASKKKDNDFMCDPHISCFRHL